jgi:hypothetical protein
MFCEIFFLYAPPGGGARWETETPHGAYGPPRPVVYVYVFVGAGFPMHCDLIWSIVRPL